MRLCKPLRRHASEAIKSRRRDEKIQQRAGNQTANNDDCNWIQNFLARLVLAQHKRNKSKPSRDCGHQHRRDALLTAADDELLAPRLVFMGHQVNVMTDHQHTIARCDTSERNKSDKRCDAEWLARDCHRGHAANERKGNIEHDLCGDHA